MARIIGNSRPNLLRGTNKADLIKGNGGPDALFGKGGNDKLHGDSGRDLLQGDKGQDKMWGGSGGDVFRFKSGDAVPSSGNRDTIYDYQLGVDKIDVPGPGTLAGVFIFELVGVGTVVTYDGASEEILVRDKLPGQFTDADFI